MVDEKRGKDTTGRGRPTKFTPVLVEQAARMFELGLTDEQVSYAIGIARATLSNWKKDNPDFLDTIKKAKAAADSQVEVSLFKRAIGYEHEAVKIFCNKDGKATQVPYVEHYPPDTGACIFWKKNRDPDRWKDKRDVGDSGGEDFAKLLKAFAVIMKGSE